MHGYSSRDVARLLDLSVAQVRSYTRAGFLEPRRGSRGEYRFSFQDLVLLRTAKGLIAARIPARLIRRTLRKLRERLPSGRPLTAVQVAALGQRIVVRDGRTLWNPESGQTCFNFDVGELAEKVAPLARRAARRAFESSEEQTAEDWFALGRELEPSDPAKAREAYRRALELEPAHARAHINLGRLLHEAGRPDAAQTHYRLALAARPGDPTAAFNLGVALEDLGQAEEALRAYRLAVDSDPRCADAHYNLARLYEDRGRKADALRHYRAYRKLLEGDVQ
jgi:tetratricopeptide (TPR) repeat protein